MQQAIILAGGKGTRLRERLGDLPKPLIDLCGMPLLERQILLLKRYGFRRILILVNYRAEHIREFCASKCNWELDVECIDDGEPRGTAGAVLSILERLDPEFLVMYGDTMLQVDLARFEQYHAEAADTAATLFLHPNDHPQDSDLVEVDEGGRIVAFHPYPHQPGRFLPNLVNAALYCVRRDALLPWRERAGMLDFGKDIFPEMIARGVALRGYNSPEYIKDVGTPARIDKVSADFAAGRIERAALDHRQRAVFLDRDGTINREVDHLCRVDQFELLPGVEQAVRRLNRAEYRVCVVTNQPVIARGECTVDGLRQIHNKMETLLGAAGAYVDRILYCPHHPDRGFAGEVPELKTECNCRKPATGMIDTAAADLNIDLARSWMIGDASADVLAARRAGLRSVLVRTGHAGLDHKYPVSPDYTAEDLPSAVEFILETHPRLCETLRPVAHDIRPGELVFIGGQSRSGKSTVASVLRELLELAGNRVHVLCTDDWLHSASERGVGVLGRHDALGLERTLRQLQGRQAALTLQLPAYLKGRREQLPEAKRLDVAPGDIIIVEGVVALHFAQVLNAAHRIFVDVDEPVRHQRLLREYAVRESDADAGSRLYASRLLDEVPWVEAGSAGALRLNLPASAGVDSH